MSQLQNKIDFVAFVSVNMANANGDPLNGNRPRMDYNGFGEMSDVCVKRKIRNRMQDLGYSIFVQSDDKRSDEFGSLSERASAKLGKIKDKDTYASTACSTWMDVRAFGQVFAFKADKGGVSVGVRGPVSIHQAVSVSPVEIESLQITKSVNGEPNEKRSSDTMGMKHYIRFGIYKIKGSINVQLAEKTGFTEEDADIVKECLRTLFLNDSSSARPEGSMEVLKLYWYKHNCKDGQYSSATVHRAVEVHSKIGDEIPKSVDDYEFIVNELPGLEPEIIDGI